MEAWLLALIALALVPTVRVFMAAGCPPRRREAAHGIESLTVEVSANGSNPNDPPERDAAVFITAGEFQVNTPSGRASLSGDVPAGGLPGRTYPVSNEMFGDESPYHWSANCTVSYQCTEGPSDLVESGTISAVHTWDWDAHRDGTVRFVLQIRDVTPEDPERPRAPGTILVHQYAWELAHSNS